GERIKLPVDNIVKGNKICKQFLTLCTCMIHNSRIQIFFPPHMTQEHVNDVSHNFCSTSIIKSPMIN
uniref:Uncharacterized protein n=1 Tax=Oryza brachyantha TaxID=4533 RepID=J3MGI7_ORYBR